MVSSENMVSHEMIESLASSLREIFAPGETADKIIVEVIKSGPAAKDMIMDALNYYAATCIKQLEEGVADFSREAQRARIEREREQAARELAEKAQAAQDAQSA